MNPDQILCALDSVSDDLVKLVWSEGRHLRVVWTGSGVVKVPDTVDLFPS